MNLELNNQSDHTMTLQTSNSQLSHKLSLPQDDSLPNPKHQLIDYPNPPKTLPQIHEGIIQLYSIYISIMI